VAHVYLIRPASSIRKFNAGYSPTRAQKVSTGEPPCAETVHNKKEEDEGEEEERISSILGRFAARKRDPTYVPGRQERRKVQVLLREGYSAEQIATAIDQAFDARSDSARPVRGFGFIVSYAHRRLSPIGATTGMPTETLTGETPPTGARAGASTEEPTGASRLPEPHDNDPLDRVGALLHAASVQDLDGVEDVRYDLPGIRLGLRRLLEMPHPYSGQELYDAVLAAVSRGVQPQRLVGYVEAVLQNGRAQAREQERVHRTIVEAVCVGQDGRETTQMGAPEDRDERYPRLTREALTLWRSALSELELQMTRATFDTWLKPARLLAWERSPNYDSGNGPTRVILGVSNRYVKDWLECRLYTPIRRTLSGIAGQQVEVESRVADQTELQDRPWQVKE
jgi:hypothetical protein